MRTRRLGVGAAIIDGRLHEGDVAVAGDRIAEVGLSSGGSGLAVPGLVDLQVNGFAGIDFLTERNDDASVAASRRLMRAQGRAPGAELGARLRVTQVLCGGSVVAEPVGCAS